MKKLIATTIISTFLIIAVTGAVSFSGIIKFSSYNPKNISQFLKDDLNKKELTLGSPVFIRIFKESKALEIWVQNNNQTYQLYNTYPICNYSGNLGPKLKEGDKQAPEGFYKVTKSQMNPNSTYHLSFNLGYPNKYDKAHDRTGSYLMVHGNCVSIGCYAMTDEKIEEIYTMVDKALDGGQKYVPVHIFPFKMTDNNLKQHSGSKWYSFWLNLKEGYDLFESNKNVPNVEVKDKKYIVKL